MQEEEEAWVLSRVWVPEEEAWREASTEEKEQGLPPQGPHCCEWLSLTQRSAGSPPLLPPTLENQYYVSLTPGSYWCPTPPAYERGCGPGLQGLSCDRVHAPDFNGLQGLRYLSLSQLLGEETRLEQVSTLTNLKQLLLTHTDLEEVPASWSALKQLEVLEIDNVRGLNAFLENLTRLKSLKIEDLSSRALPSNISRLTSLRTLHLSCYYTLEEFPSSIGTLSTLQTLHLAHCSALLALPSTIGDLSSLQKLNLAGCSSLRALPESFGRLSSLQTLVLARCSSLESLPQDLGDLVALETLDLSGCSSLRDVSQSLDDSY